jgi:hypothetical protein
VATIAIALLAGIGLGVAVLVFRVIVGLAGGGL